MTRRNDCYRRPSLLVLLGLVALYSRFAPTDS